MLDECFAKRPKLMQLIIHEGVPYSLKRLEHEMAYDPCQKCDLRGVCYNGKVTLSLLPLCQPDGYDAGWFFEENWDIVDKRVVDFIKIDCH